MKTRDALYRLTITAALGSTLLAAAPGLAQQVAPNYAGSGLRNKQPASPLTLGAGDPALDAAGTGSKRAGEWKAYGRYQFSETWGVEFNYADWGRSGISAPFVKPGAGTPGALGALGALGAPGPFDAAQGLAKGSQLNLSATGTLPLARGLSLTGKLGYGRNVITGSPYCLSAACGPLSGGSRDGARAGLGLRYSFSDNWGLRLDYENVNNLADPNALPGKGNSWSAKIRYTF